MDVLADRRFTVPIAEPADCGVAWLRANVARFSEGADHARRRQLVEHLLAPVEPERLRRPGSPTANLAEALGLDVDADLVADISAVAGSYQPHAPQGPEADAALERLVDRLGGRDEATAAVICILVQAHGATLALIAGDSPPVPSTRRIDPTTGLEVIVDLTNAPFGAGHHACPGREHALAMAAGADRPDDPAGTALGE